jgi:signal transduction histidine kinase
MRVLRAVIWGVGIAVLALAIPVVRGLPVTSYGGVAAWRIWLEAAAAIALLVVSAAEPGRPGRGVAAGIAGATWLVPELAGWVAGPVWLATVADAWSRLLPAFVLAAVLAGQPRYRRAVSIAICAGAIAAGARLFFVDPFLEVRCWRRCDHNPALIVHTALGSTLDHLGAVVMAGCVLAAGVLAVRGWRWPAGVAAVLLTVGSVGPGVARIFVAESATSALYLGLFAVAQAGALALAIVLVRAGVLQWRLRVRLVRLSGRLSSPQAPGSVAAALRRAVPDPQLQARYWAAGRAAFVDADGQHPADPPESDATQRVTLVKRRGQLVAALVHAREVDGTRLDRALGPALRLVLENEQLRAATMAELRELTQSRARIVERAGLERRRLERNLHDGAQQRVVSLSLLVRMVAHRVEHDPGSLTLARRAAMLTDATVEELRRVARGIYPAVLSDAGLSGALLDLAESSTDIAVRVNGIPSARYGGTVETTAYLTAVAALANARRCDASVLNVSGCEHDGVLVLDLHDDATARTRHHPALDLADQVEALGGTLAAEPRCGGSRVHLELPCGS